MKAVLVALVVFAAVLGAQASHLADLSTVAVLESGLKSFENLPECVISLIQTASEEVDHLAEECFRSNTNGPLGQWACVVSNVASSVTKLSGVLYECLSN